MVGEFKSAAELGRFAKAGPAKYIKSGRKLGWTKYGPVKRLWYGTPGATKAAGVSSLASLDALGHAVPDEDDVW